ncbi:TonB-dependent receptor [Xinfangfangia sp. CPCC 101601]|uniref:TonB-dependent receptor n=1 Tax=Pseudogemmobacter lacusdianii TaxID=3069608 RepID=A0ABU0W170_9RHOB|nr:TonB-dependent receptor [Xinfangfangia sp. CPCC 101601]MDQ2066840.1 TonB-dependent receptor [Xinfangfangia sp. CPCC 101601]
MTAFSMTTRAFARRSIAALMTGGSLLCLLQAPSWAETPSVKTGGIHGCPLIGGQLPDNCARPDAGHIIPLAPGKNTEKDGVAPIAAPEGFRITIEEPKRPAPSLDGATERKADLLLASDDIQVSFSGLETPRRLSLVTSDGRAGYVAGSRIGLRPAANYPAWVTSAELRIADAARPHVPLAKLPVTLNHEAAWVMPDTAEVRDYVVVLRVYDAAGRFDETTPVTLSRLAKDQPTEPKNAPLYASDDGEDMTRRRAIPVRGGTVTVSGSGPEGASSIEVMGERVALDGSGRFVIERILPPGVHTIRAGANGPARRVEIPVSDWFYVGQADLTYGTDKTEGSYALGRLAGYAKGVTAGGYTFRLSADTREGELRDLIRDLDEKNPDRVQARIAGDDVYPTFGDDSQMIDDAPTSGKLYARVDHGNSHLMWGDFQATPGSSPLIRSDRTLYGAQGKWVSPQVTPSGEAAAMVTLHAANPDRLSQRDVLRGTGGSAYFLRRQDILPGTETIWVEMRDPISGRVIERRQLAEDTDYEIDFYQGVVILRRPLSSSVGDGFLTDRPLGGAEANLVVQYEYVPTIGDVDGYSTGGRAEAWIGEHLRLGVSGQRDTSGVSDNTAAGGDLLLRQSEATWLRLDLAQSEGPGFGASHSLNGGLDNDPRAAETSGKPSNGALGLKGRAYGLNFAADLAELSNSRLSGEIAGFAERRERGFVSADHDVAATQSNYGLSGKIAFSDRYSLGFNLEAFSDADGQRDDSADLRFITQLTEQWRLEAGIAHSRRIDSGSTREESGLRTDGGMRLVWERDEDHALWAFAQGTLRKTGTMETNDRFGLGGAWQLSERYGVEGEVSTGSLGGAGRLALTQDNGAGSSYHIGYALDPLRRYDQTLTGRDGGTFVTGASQKLSEAVSLQTEARFDRLGANPALTNTYGVSYRPSDLWTWTGGIDYGSTETEQNGTYRRLGYSAGVHYAEKDGIDAALRSEYRVDRSTDGKLDRENWLIDAGVTWKIDEEQRLLFDLAAAVSTSSQDSLRDGRYIEANIGYAFRPVMDDRLNLLLRYTWLEDLPGPDQVNVAGDIEGPRQRSHIFSIDANYDLNTQWTIGAKLGHRSGTVETRGTGELVDNAATLAILRADYNFVHNWDVMAELRSMRLHEHEVTENAGLISVYRHLGSNVKLGVGYLWGEVSDDLRLIEGEREGMHINLLAKF